MSKDHLSHEITAKLKHFLEAKSPQEAEYQKEIDALKSRIEHEKYPAIVLGLKAAIKELEKNRPDNTTFRKQEAADLLLAIAKDLGLPLGGKGKGGKKAKGTRLNKEGIETLKGKILSVPELKAGVAIGLLAASLGESGIRIRPILKKLQASGKVALIGTKKNAIWKIA